MLAEQVYSWGVFLFDLLDKGGSGCVRSMARSKA